MLRLFSQAVVDLDLRSAWRRGLLLLACAAPSLLLAYGAIRWAYAETLADKNQVIPLQRAVALDPRNPQFFDKLGRISLYSVNAPPNPDPVEYFQRAVALAPLEADYWADLASACDWKGNVACADRSLSQALKLAPFAPRFEWFTANHYVRTARPSLALPHLRRLLELSPEYGSATFDLCARAFGNTEMVMTEVLTRESNPVLKLAFLDYEAAHDRLDVASRVWPEISSAKADIPFDRVQSYFERLVAAGEIAQAEAVWSDLQRHGTVASESSGNLVFNGRFEQTPLNGGFDWQFTKLPFVQADFHDTSRPSGAPCLRLDFTVARNDEVEPVFQLVPVQASTDYTLTAQVRSVLITSDSGPRLRVTDALAPAEFTAQSEGTVGTTVWHEITLHFTTGAKTRLLRLSVWRPRSRAFPPNIAGSFWLGDVWLGVGSSPPVAKSTRAP